MFDVLQVEGLVPAERHDPARSAHHYVGEAALHHLFILLDADPTEEHGCLHRVEILTETLILLVDLKGKLSGEGERGKEGVGRREWGRREWEGESGKERVGRREWEGREWEGESGKERVGRRECEGESGKEGEEVNGGSRQRICGYHGLTWCGT